MIITNEKRDEEVVDEDDREYVHVEN